MPRLEQRSGSVGGPWRCQALNLGSIGIRPHASESRNVAYSTLALLRLLMYRDRSIMFVPVPMVLVVLMLLAALMVLAAAVGSGGSGGGDSGG